MGKSVEPKRTSVVARALLAAPLALVTATSCSTTSPDLALWRAREPIARLADTTDTARVLADIERERDADQLASARQLALALVTIAPDDPRALVAASRAESDALVMFASEDEDVRNGAAASARDYAELASARGASGAAFQAQLAWALGASTHLRPMSERSAHAHRTIEAANAALALDADEPTALATLAMVHWRLETLPWIAKLMASGLPESSLEDAERFARRALGVRASRENKLVLARVLVAQDRDDEARRLFDEALSTAPKFPRDAALEPALRRERDDL